MFRRFALSLLVATSMVLALAFVLAAESQHDSAARITPQYQTDGRPAQDGPTETAKPGWTHVGCIQLGSECFDVFEDKKGDLWVCDECFTTQNPNPGKCRRLTDSELEGAVWCA